MAQGRRTAPLRLEIGPAALVGRWRRAPAAPTIAILIDGAVQAIVPAGPEGFVWALPAGMFGRLLDVVAAPGGESLLEGPALFERWRRVEWDGWEREGAMIEVRFRVLGRAAPAADLPIVTELWGADGRYALGFGSRQGSTYRAKLPLQRLPGREGVILRPRIGTALLDSAIEVPAAATPYFGHVDRGEPWRVSGWLSSRAGPEARAALYLDGSLAATVAAGSPRPDVAEAGLGDANVGFAFAFPPAVGLDRAVLVDVRAGVDGPSLSGSPYLRPSTSVLGRFDRIDGFYAAGWAFADAGRPVTVEAVCDDTVIGRATADLTRGDLIEAGLPSAACGFKIPLEWSTAQLLGRDVSVRLADGGPTLPGSPQRLEENPNVGAFLERGRHIAPATMARLRRMITRRTASTLVSIVMPVFDTRRDWLAAAIGSVRAQWSPHWELLAIDDGSTEPHVAPMLEAYARQDKRIRVISRPRNGGIAQAVNDGIAAATGDLVAVLDHDDALEPDAVYHVARAAQETGADLLYSDEVLTGEDLDQLLDLRARPAWSHDYYLSHPYFVHWVATRTPLARRLGWDTRLPISADVDFVLRAVEQANAVAHIPRVLYRWRTVPGSAGHRARAQVSETMPHAVGGHLRRLGLPARAKPAGENQVRLDWADPGGEVLVVIPTKDRADLLERCLSSLARTAENEPYRVVIVDHQSREDATRRLFEQLDGRHTVMRQDGPFNFARLNNRAVSAHAGETPFLLFLNNDVEAIAPGWLGRLRSLAARPDVGAVGPLLLYGNDRVQHAGALVGFSGAAEHAMKHVSAFLPGGVRNEGVNCNLTATRDCSAVTAACLMMRTESFRRLGGFDEAFAVGFNDTDLCLRLRAAGLRVLYDGQTVLYHRESATRSTLRAVLHPDDDERLRERWAGYVTHGDPFYSPLLSQSGTDYQVRSDLGWKGKLEPRVVRLR